MPVVQNPQIAFQIVKDDLGGPQPDNVGSHLFFEIGNSKVVDIDAGHRVIQLQDSLVQSFDTHGVKTLTTLQRSQRVTDRRADGPDHDDQTADEGIPFVRRVQLYWPGTTISGTPGGVLISTGAAAGTLASTSLATSAALSECDLVTTR